MVKFASATAAQVIGNAIPLQVTAIVNCVAGLPEGDKCLVSVIIERTSVYLRVL